MHTYTVPDQPATVTATYEAEYYLTIQARQNGITTPGSDWYNCKSRSSPPHSSDSKLTFST